MGTTKAVDCDPCEVSTSSPPSVGEVVLLELLHLA